MSVKKHPCIRWS